MTLPSAVLVRQGYPRQEERPTENWATFLEGVKAGLDDLDNGRLRPLKEVVEELGLG